MLWIDFRTCAQRFAQRPCRTENKNQTSSTMGEAGRSRLFHQVDAPVRFIPGCQLASLLLCPVFPYIKYLGIVKMGKVHVGMYADSQLLCSREALWTEGMETGSLERPRLAWPQTAALSRAERHRRWLQKDIATCRDYDFGLLETQFPQKEGMILSQQVAKI